MKKLLTIAASAVLCLGIHAEDIVATTLFEDCSTNTWTAADLQAALQLLNRMYHRDIKSAEGRRRWHGDPKHSVATNAETRIIESVETYSDGFVFRDPGKRRKLRTPEEEAAWYLARKENRRAGNTNTIERLRQRIAALEVQRANATNELDMAHAIINLAALRKRIARLEATQTNVVTVTVSP